MQVQAPVIQVGSANGGGFSVAEHLLGMAKAWGIFKDPHAPGCQSRIVGPGHSIYNLFIRNTRCDNPYIHPPLCRKAQGIDHFIRDDQIGCHHIKRLFCRVNQVQINALRNPFPAQGVILIRLHIAHFPRSAVSNGQKPLQVLFAAGTGIPHFQKGHSQAANRLTFQPDTGILPAAIEDLSAKILV